MITGMSAPKTQNMSPWAFVLAVPDLQVSAGYFRDKLGFRVMWDDATDWRLVERDGVRVMLGHCPNDAKAADLGSHNWFGYISVNDIDALHEEFTARGADCTPPFDQGYGMRETVVTTVDGHRIVFGQRSGMSENECPLAANRKEKTQ